MSNIYDIFRGVQAKKTSNTDDRSAAFILEGFVSREITHIRLDKTINAALVFEDAEGPDEVITYTLKSDDLLKSDYFDYEGDRYLVYEDVRLSNKDILWKKQMAVECNINFTYETNQIYGYFTSNIRSNASITLKKDVALLPDETSLLIVPTSYNITINKEIQLGNKGWKIVDYDRISNNGISYLYLERTQIDNIEPDILETHEEEPQTNNILNPMVEYNFETQNAYFVADPEVNVLQKTATNIKFTVPFGIPSVEIFTKDNTGTIIDNTYEVVE